MLVKTIYFNDEIALLICFNIFSRWGISICLGHIEPVLPFVSDLGVIPPEAPLFSLFMNFGSVLLIFFSIIRFESMKTFINNNNRNPSTLNKQDLKKWNGRSLTTGICMATGFMLVANFRNSEGVLVQSIHNIGAVFGFFSTVTDMYFQSKVANGMSLTGTGRFRTILAICALILAITYNLLSVVSFASYSDALLNTELRLKWNSSESGYVFHVISTVLEWILIFSLSPYFFSFISQFRLFSLSKQLIVYKDINENSINSI